MDTEAYEFLGHTIEVRSNSADVLAHLRSVYERFRSRRSTTTDVDPTVHRIEIEDTIDRDGGLAIRSTFGTIGLWCRDLGSFDTDRYPDESDGDPLSVVQWLVLRDVGQLSRDHVLLHAGAVARNGRAIVLPADSGGGKTTTTLRLVLAGYGFLSDEVACIHLDRGTVEPFPRRINLAESARRRLGVPRPSRPPDRRRDGEEEEWSLDVGTIDGATFAPASRLALVLFPDGFARSTRLTPVADDVAAVDMLRRSHAPLPRPAPTMYRLAGVLRGVRCYRMVVGEPDDAAEAIAGLFADAVTGT